MPSRSLRWTALMLLSGGVLLASGTCNAVVDTIRLAFNIVDVWV